MDDARTTINTGRDVWVLVFLEDGRHLLSGGREEIIRQWDVEDRREVEDQRLTASGHSQVTAIALSGDGNWIVGGGSQAITVWNRRTRQSARTGREHSGWVNDVHVSPDSTKFATASSDCRAIIWNIFNGRPLIPPFLHSNNVSSVRFSPDGGCIATAVQDGELRIYNAYNGQLLSNIAVASFPSIARAIAWSSAQHIFALSSGNVLRHIYVDTGTFLSEWTILGEPQPDNYGSVALSSNGKFIASFVGRSLTFWDTSTHAQFGPVFDHPEAPYLYSFAISPDNNYLATSGWGGIITLHNLTDIIPLSHRVGGDLAQPPQTGNGADLQPQIEALRGILRALELRSGESGSATTEHAQAQITPLRISNGTYRIKSNTGNLYLTRPQDGTGTVIVQRLDQSNASQKWTIFHSNDVYNIMGSTDALLTIGIRNALITGRRGTTWIFEPRGDAYVIGNAINVTAIELAPNRQSVSVSPRSNSANHRWVLEPVTN